MFKFPKQMVTAYLLNQNVLDEFFRIFKPIRKYSNAPAPIIGVSLVGRIGAATYCVEHRMD